MTVEKTVQQRSPFSYCLKVTLVHKCEKICREVRVFTYVLSITGLDSKHSKFDGDVVGNELFDVSTKGTESLNSKCTAYALLTKVAIFVQALTMARFRRS